MGIMNLTSQAQSCWAKASNEHDNDTYLPLFVHLSDAIKLAELLWKFWLPDRVKKIIISPIAATGIDEERASLLAKQLLVFLAGAHDLGKASPVFQMSQRAVETNPALLARIKRAKLPLPRLVHLGKPRHELISYEILMRHMLNKTLAIVLGSHHGKPPTDTDFQSFVNRGDAGFEDEGWISVQDELFQYVVELSGTDTQLLRVLHIGKAEQVILTGLVIMVDWISSDANRFPLISTYEKAESSTLRARKAWDSLGLPSAWEAPSDWQTRDIYQMRFGFSARPIQQSIIDVLSPLKEPGIVVIEAPPGEGKTEAALVAAELYAEKLGCGGVFVALPTQATSDGLAPRIWKWLSMFKGKHTINLVHGKARFNDEFQGIVMKSRVGGFDDDEDQNVIVNDWFQGRKKGVLSDFVVGTIDQVLLAGLKQKHFMLRHLALANKVIIIDECHAYDAYMNQYLTLVLNWLGAYGVPVIVLSATLPSQRRQEVIDAYLNTLPLKPVIAWRGEKKTDNEVPEWAVARDYPLITYTTGSQVHQEKGICQSDRALTVDIRCISEDAIMLTLDDLLSAGGYAGVIVNTVSRAQTLTKTLKEHFGEDSVLLLHSRFLAPDRMKREKEMRELLGPETVLRSCGIDKKIIVGTQVLEQSLDVDFDVLITDICPMDLLIQRMGRLHRHKRPGRPEKLKSACCFVTGIEEEGGFDSGAKAIYHTYLLMNTKELLPSTIVLPDDIPHLVQEAYQPKGLEVAPQIQAQYLHAKAEHEEKIEDQKKRAERFQLSKPYAISETIKGWLDISIASDPSGKRAEATVRDTSDSLSVLVVQKCKDGTFRVLPWVTSYGGQEIPFDYVPEDALAREVAKCTVTLPSSLCYPGIIDRVITAFERDNLERGLGLWQDSFWLNGELFLVLDEDFEATVAGFKLAYCQDYGLSAQRIKEE
jgi:CRISPR-associated endonuclease/helicase Cas3